MARVFEMKTAKAPPRQGMRALVGFGLIALGLTYMALGPIDQGETHYESLGEDTTLPAWLAEANPKYQAKKIRHYAISRDGHQPVKIDAIEYLDDSFQARSATFLAATDPADDNPLRQEIWKETAAAIQKKVSPGAIFLSWWDNSQRLNFLTGVQTWVKRPDPASFPDSTPRRFGEQSVGGFETGAANRQLAKWLVMDAEQAEAEMARKLPKDRPVYFLVTLDDLARVSEIESLADTRLPFETRIFPSTGNIHDQIAAVRRWASDHGAGSYLVQQLRNGAVRAWRITTEAGTRTLLARLLPFTSSLLKPLVHHALIFQSRWGAYLSVYQWRP